MPDKLSVIFNKGLVELHTTPWNHEGADDPRHSCRVFRVADIVQVHHKRDYEANLLTFYLRSTEAVVVVTIEDDGEARTLYECIVDMMGQGR